MISLMIELPSPSPSSKHVASLMLAAEAAKDQGSRQRTRDDLHFIEICVATAREDQAEILYRDSSLDIDVAHRDGADNHEELVEF